MVLGRARSIFYAAKFKEGLKHWRPDLFLKFFFFFQPFLGASQYHWLSNHLGPKRDLHFACPDGCQDPFRTLPSLLTSKILSYLDPISLLRCRQVCHFWKHLFSSEWIWHRLCYQPKWMLAESENEVQLERHRTTGKLKFAYLVITAY